MENTTLLAYLAHEQIAPLVRRSWFAGEFIPLGHFLWRAQALFETGTAIGASFRDNLLPVVALFSKPGEESKMLDALRMIVPPSGEAAVPPENLGDIFLKPEAERLVTRLREEGRTKARQFAQSPRVAKTKLRVPDCLMDAQQAVRRGLGWGSQQPELIERLCSKPLDPDIWRMARRFEPELPDQLPEPVPLRVRQKEARSVLQQYVMVVRPDLLAQLGLWPEGADTFELRWRALRARLSPGEE